MSVIYSGNLIHDEEKSLYPEEFKSQKGIFLQENNYLKKSAIFHSNILKSFLVS